MTGPRSFAGVRETVWVTIQRWPDAPPLQLNNDGPRILGLELASVRGTDDQPIVKVVSVDPSGTAADNGIQKDDTIVEIQQTPVSEPDQAFQIFAARSPSKHHYAAVLVDRKGKRTRMPLAVPD